MKKIIFLKLYSDLLKFFLISTFILVSIIWIMQPVNYLDIVSEDGHSLETYFWYSLLNLPKILSKTFTLSFLLSLYYLLSKYEETNQLMIYWTNKISKKYFLNRIILMTLFYSFVLASISIWIVPFTQDKARSFIRNSNLDFFTSLIKPKKFIDTVENLTIFLDEKKDNEIQKIFLKDASNSENIQVIIAKSGLLNNSDNKFLLLRNGIILNQSKNLKGTNFSFKETSLDLDVYKTKTTTFSKIQDINSLDLLKCLNILEQGRTEKFINFNCQNNFKLDIKQKIYERFYIPFYLILLSITLSFLIIMNHVNSNYKIWKLIILFTAIFFLALSQISISMISENNLKNIYILTILPISIFIFYLMFYIKVSLR